MKKRLVMILIVTLILSFTGCGEKKEEDIKPVDSVSISQSNNVDEETEEVQSTAEELKEEIIDEWDYPIKSWEDAQNSGLDYQGWKDVCNPPEDVLHSLSTQELANLALRYPLIPWMPSRATDSEASVFIGAYGGSSTIFSELRNREDRNVCILEAYAENVPNVEEWDSYDAANWAEHFVEQYLFVFSKELTKEEREFYLKTVEEKKEKYYCNIEEPFVAPGLSFDENGTAYRKGYDGR